MEETKKQRLILVLQYPVRMRYSFWYVHEFVEQLSKEFEVKVLGEEYINEICFGDPAKYDKEMFSPIIEAAKFELIQTRQYLDLQLRKDDILLLNDISFTGFFSNALYHKKPSKTFAICHATSKNSNDYFKDVRSSKWKVESAHALLFDKIFIATEYHKQKLGWKNCVVTALPKAPFSTFKMEEKKYDIINVSRPTRQKVNKQLEHSISKRFGKIIRQTFDNWQDYYNFVARSKCMFISANEETFGYQILDAIYNNCIPIVPNKFSYPELLPPSCLYDNEAEALQKVENVLEGRTTLPKLINQKEIDDFFPRIIQEIKEN